MEEIKWVLTVPAIWTDSAKQFMRKSAEKAGIPSQKLLLALEPEAASIYCQYLPTEKLQGVDHGFSISEEGTKFMIVDIGGGTADITVHQKMADGCLRELCGATGNDCGGTSVDSQFFQLLVRIVGGPIMKKIKSEDPSSYLDLFREFETVKRTVNSSRTGKINITIPYTSLDTHCKKHLGEDLTSVLQSSACSNKISLRGDKMRIDADLFRGLYKPTIASIISLMNEILSEEKARDVSMLLLVGGFAECILIQEEVRRCFPNKRVIIPEEAGLSVLKGAVLFGHKPNYIEARAMRFTYGVATRSLFDSTIHDMKHLVVDEKGTDRCENVFAVFKRKNEIVKAGDSVKDSFETAHKMQKTVSFVVYTSTSESPIYTDEDGCTKLSELKLNIPNPSVESRTLDVEFVFGNTEISVTAVDCQSGEDISTTLDFL